MTDNRDGSPGFGQATLTDQLDRCRCPVGQCTYPIVAVNRRSRETGVCFSCRHGIHFGHREDQ